MAGWAEAEELLLNELAERIRLKTHVPVIWEALAWTKDEVDPGQFPDAVWAVLPETFLLGTTVTFSYHGKLWTLHLWEQKPGERYIGWGIDTREDGMTEPLEIMRKEGYDPPWTVRSFS